MLVLGHNDKSGNPLQETGSRLSEANPSLSPASVWIGNQLLTTQTELHGLMVMAGTWGWEDLFTGCGLVGLWLGNSCLFICWFPWALAVNLHPFCQVGQWARRSHTDKAGSLGGSPWIQRQLERLGQSLGCWGLRDGLGSCYGISFWAASAPDWHWAHLKRCGQAGPAQDSWVLSSPLRQPGQALGLKGISSVIGWSGS